MRSLSVLGAAALLAVHPASASAQSTSTSANPEVLVHESTTEVAKEAPKPAFGGWGGTQSPFDA
jgi:hypothetical protein